jgi:hypothetical protein
MFQAVGDAMQEQNIPQHVQDQVQKCMQNALRKRKEAEGCEDSGESHKAARTI